jgi:hypothetical protein
MNTRSRNARPGLKVQTSIKAGGLQAQHNEMLASIASPPPVGIRVRTSIKAGGLTSQHNRAPGAERRGSGLKVRTSVKAGGVSAQHNRAMV